jgi:signal transduction histidine kinase/ActR/RegA family two-component response regulator
MANKKAQSRKSKRAVATGRKRRATGVGAKRATKRPIRPARKRAATRGAKRDSGAIEIVMAAFAHDIRTPLTGILALSELLATSGLGERERRWVAAIKDAAEHLAELTTLVVDSARAGAGRAVPRHEVFHLPRLAAALAVSLGARAEAKDLACETDIAADLPEHVRGDAAQLRIALENLMANAVKFTERGKVGLKIAAAPVARDRLQLTFTVTDSGIGMSPAEIRRLFRPFAQANREIVQKFGGAGLGLVQARRLARAMGGDLEVESAPGRGATFRLTVTVDRAAAEEASVGALGAGPHGGTAAHPLNVLCVEDNPYGRVVMNAILTELGHRVDFTGTGESAIEAVAGGGHDVVLMDVTLAGIDGFEATRRIRALPGAAAMTPVIGISGRTAAGDVAAATAAGMNAYLTKPVSPRVLAETLADVQGGAVVAR